MLKKGLDIHAVPGNWITILNSGGSNKVLRGKSYLVLTIAANMGGNGRKYDMLLSTGNRDTFKWSATNEDFILVEKGHSTKATNNNLPIQQIVLNRNTTTNNERKNRNQAIKVPRVTPAIKGRQRTDGNRVSGRRVTAAVGPRPAGY